jgi:SAM-dependent methyltransferase
VPCSTLAAVQEITHFILLRSDCPSSASTWRRRRWRPAKQKVHDRGIAAEFATADALALERLQRVFDSVLDCGLFHTFDADERRRYVASLSSVTKRDGTLYVLCFSDIGPDIGPHPVTRDELSASFTPGSGWEVAAIEPARIHTRFHGEHGAPAWLATVTQV